MIINIFNDLMESQELRSFAMESHQIIKAFWDFIEKSEYSNLILKTVSLLETFEKNMDENVLFADKLGKLIKSVALK